MAPDSTTGNGEERDEAEGNENFSGAELERLRLETERERAKAEKEKAKAEQRKVRLRYYQFLIKLLAGITTVLTLLFGAVRRLVGFFTS
jgi:hypothetical protein